jgi:hypothetical protein
MQIRVIWRTDALSAITTKKGPAGQCLTAAKCAASTFLQEEVWEELTGRPPRLPRHRRCLGWSQRTRLRWTPTLHRRPPRLLRSRTPWSSRSRHWRSFPSLQRRTGWGGRRWPATTAGRRPATPPSPVPRGPGCLALEAPSSAELLLGPARGGGVEGWRRSSSLQAPGAPGTRRR